MKRTPPEVLEDLPNVGPATARDLRLLGVQVPADLIGRDPYELYAELARRTGSPQDPCVIDVFIAAVAFMEGEPAQPWWHYTAERKAKLADKGRSGAEGCDSES
ncbi:MAG: helix-hairpin-helix domain-containing protein [Coriobacteriia bacterium]